MAERDKMNIALIAHDNRKELMVQFCTAYAGILARHTLCATNTTGKVISDATGLSIHLFMNGSQGGDEQIGARIDCNEIDLVLYFHDPNSPEYDASISYMAKLCDKNRIPFATNSATAEALVLALGRGDLDWRDIVNPKTKPFMA
jgi:methylglyoxal synthase